MPKFVAAALLLSNAAIWVWLLARASLRGEAIPFEPRRPVPWKGADLAWIVGAYVGVYALVALVGGALVGRLEAAGPGLDDGKAKVEAKAARLPAELLTDAAVKLAMVAAVVLALRRRRGADSIDLGFDFRRLGADVGVGIVAFAAVAVPIYVLQNALVQRFPTQHPVIEDWNALSPAGRWCGLFSIALVAPLAEEFFFRVVLQGWLESLSAARRPRGAILLSSAIFALMHVAHGPAPIPLFFFALVLGYLYQQTHRLWPSVVVHFSLNACSLAVLWLLGE